MKWQDIVDFMKRPSNEVAAEYGQKTYEALPSMDKVKQIANSNIYDLLKEKQNGPVMDQDTQDTLFSGITSPLKPVENIQPQSEINPLVKEYIQRKIASNQPTQQLPESLPLIKKPEYMDKYNDEAYAKAKTDYESRQSGLGFAELASGIGDALARRDSSNTDKYFQNLKSNLKDETIGQFQRDKANSVEDFKNKQMMDIYNPDSQQSISFRKMIESKFPEVAKSYGKMWNQVSAADKENIFEPLKLKEMVEARKDQTKMQMMNHKEMIDLKKAELIKKNLPEERIKNLSGTDKARFDNALMTLKGIDDMGAALDNGQNTFSLVGDNDYTAASRRATEAYGRMQSGGAINKEEEKRFEATLPRTSDAKEMQRSKLLKQRDEMLSRIKTLGFTPEQIDYQPKSFSYGSKESPQSNIESKINSFMQKNGISDKNEAIRILKEHGKI